MAKKAEKKAERKTEKKMRCGMVSIVGRPNVGKSTLLNNIVGEKVAIVSHIPQTTRNPVRGIYSDDRGQIVFIDTPGLHMSKDKLDKFMSQSAYGSIQNVDCVIHLVDTNEPTGRDEENIVNRLAGLRVPVILGLNKVDIKKTPFLPEYISLWEQVKGKPVNELKNFSLLPLSGKESINMDKLLDMLFECLPEGPMLYPTDSVTDVPQRMAIADIVREKFLNILRQEIPHSLAVIVEDITRPKRKVMHIRILVLIETESQKRIVIGKNGQNLKKVGTQARLELEPLLESKVFLEIFVKDKRKWRDNPSLLEEMGYIFL